ncbi:MAG TPA: PAS domain-containing protein, partial [Polyangia bacterium]|nr:PAS domain-containing protein [Polyangia bacterium]
MDVLLVTDRSGVLTLADGSALAAFGMRAQDVGKAISVAAAAVPEIVEGCRRSLSGLAHAAAVNVGGACFDLRFRPLPAAAHDVGGAVVLAIERSQPAPELARSEALLAEAQRLAHVGSWEWNIAPNIVSWSDEMHRIYGIELGHFDGTYEAFLARVHPDDRQHTENVVLE